MGKSAVAHIHLRDRGNDVNLRITLRGAAFVRDDHRSQRIALRMNGTEKGAWDVNFGQERFEKSFDIKMMDGEDMLELVFTLPDATSPARLGESLDKRHLGMLLGEVRVEAIEPRSAP